MTLRDLSPRQVSVLKGAVFALALLPFLHLLGGIFFWPESLGANPAEFITRSAGDWTLRFLLLTLAITPLRKLSGWNWLLRLRRMLGLFAFFYVLAHFLSFIAFDHVFDIAEIWADILKRPFITIGALAFLLLLPLAATSTNAMVRRLGARRWMVLHRLIYLIGVLGVIHFWLMVKRDLTEPVIYALILALLLGFRLLSRRRRRALLQTANS
jgi:sulfoxide reductase heme-binding subunit YedZ